MPQRCSIDRSQPGPIQLLLERAQPPVIVTYLRDQRCPAIRLPGLPQQVADPRQVLGGLGVAAAVAELDH